MNEAKLDERQKKMIHEVVAAGWDTGTLSVIGCAFAAVEAVLSASGLVSAEDCERKYEQGFEDCRAQAMYVVDEHDGYMKHIGSLEPTLARLSAPASGEQPAPEKAADEVTVVGATVFLHGKEYATFKGHESHEPAMRCAAQLLLELARRKNGR